MAAAGLAASVEDRLRVRLEAQGRSPGGSVLRIALGTPAACPDALHAAAGRAGMPPFSWRVLSAPGPGMATAEAVVEARRGPPGDGAGFAKEASGAGRPAGAEGDALESLAAGLLGRGAEAAGKLVEGLSAPPADGHVRRALAGMAASVAGASCGPYVRRLHAMSVRLPERGGGLPRADALCLLAARIRGMPPEAGGDGAPLDLLPPRLSGTGGWMVAGLSGPGDPRAQALMKAMASMPPVEPGPHPALLDEEAEARLGRWATALLAAAGWPEAPVGAAALSLARECGLDPVADPRAGSWLRGVAQGAPEDAAEVLLAAEAACGSAAAGLLRLCMGGPAPDPA